MVAVLTSFAVAFVWCASLPRLGPALGFYDRPSGDALKVHRRPAVPLAGPGILAGLMAGAMIQRQWDPWLFVGLTILTLLGVTDDRRELSPRTRIAAESVAAVVLSVRWWDDGVLLWAMGIAIVVVAVNAVNLYDGIDMLAGGSAASGFLITAGLAVSAEVMWLALLIGAALLGFLPFNRHPARVFLGDGGAYLIGGVLAVVSWDFGLSNGPVAAIASLGLLGMFGVDLLVTFGRRLASGQALFVGDRNHMYDRMIQRGTPIWGVVAALVSLHAFIVVTSASAVRFLPSMAALVVVTTTGIAVTAASWKWLASQTARA